jgi:cytochrome oxidase Cu insertion factor (SCO1/SenC/PrrC family)
MKSLRNVIVLVVAVAFVAAACGDSPEASGGQSSPPSDAGASSPPDPGSNRNGKQNGDQAEREDLAPDFSVETFDGDTFKLSDHRGTPVVLNFWESW